MHALIEDTQPWYQQFWPWFLISLPATAVIAGIMTINLAVTSSDGLVKDDYYKEGLAIHKDASQVQNARMLGIGAHLRLNADTGLIEIQLNAKAVARQQSLTLKVSHPTRPNHDQQVLLYQNGVGHYQGILTPLVPANWRITLSPSTDPQWRISGRLNIPQEGSITLQ